MPEPVQQSGGNSERTQWLPPERHPEGGGAPPVEWEGGRELEVTHG